MKNLDLDIAYRSGGTLAADLGSIFTRFKILDSLNPKSGHLLSCFSATSRRSTTNLKEEIVA